MISEYHLSYYCVKSLYWQEDMCIFILYDDTRIVGVHCTKQSVGIIVEGFCPNIIRIWEAGNQSTEQENRKEIRHESGYDCSDFYRYD